MTEINTDTAELLELANHYPSPHNGQPVRIEFTTDTSFRLYFERERGLQAADVSYIFSFVSMGVFAEHFDYAAQALGHRITYSVELPKESELRGAGSVLFATGNIEWNVASPDEELKQALLFRQTSRRKYKQAPAKELTHELPLIVSKDMRLVGLDSKDSSQAIWLNQRAVFDDLFDEPVRKELNHWLRYNKKEKETKRDGLSYDCMMINGRMLRYIVKYPKTLRIPILSSIIKQYYLRTMKDKSRVFYMLAPFQTEEQSFKVGRIIMKVWRRVSEQGHYLHPFGTIMSNHGAHRDFVKLAGINNESRDNSYLVFIFRLGKSPVPVPSLRIPFKEHLLKKD